MKVTTRDNWRVVAVVSPMMTHLSIGSLGFTDEWGEKPLEGDVVGPNFEITIDPGGPGWRSVGAWTFSSSPGGEEGCKEIQRGMLKHRSVIEARIVCDEKHTCSHCDCIWEELSEEDVTDPANLIDLHSIAGEPVCCDKAIEEFRTERDIPLPEMT